MNPAPPASAEAVCVIQIEAFNSGGRRQKIAPARQEPHAAHFFQRRLRRDLAISASEGQTVACDDRAVPITAGWKSVLWPSTFRFVTRGLPRP